MPPTMAAVEIITVSMGTSAHNAMKYEERISTSGRFPGRYEQVNGNCCQLWKRHSKMDSETSTCSTVMRMAMGHPSAATATGNSSR